MNRERRINMFKIHKKKKYGVVLTIQDPNLADEVDDYLTENYYVFYDLRPSEEGMEFFFGQVSSIKKVEELIAIYRAREKDKKL